MYLLNQIRKDSHLLKQDEMYYFNIRGYLFSYVLLKKQQEALCLVLNKSIINKNDLKILQNQCDHQVVIKTDQIALKEDVVYFLFDENFKEDIYPILEKITNELYQLNYHNRQNCVLCGSPCSIHCFKNILAPIDEKCIEKCLKEEQQLKEKDQKCFKKSIVFSLLGAILGLIPAFLLSYVMGGYSVVSSILLFLPAFLAVILFYKTEISRTKKMDVICLVFAFIAFMIYHIGLIIMNIQFFKIASFSQFFVQLGKYFVESLLESGFLFIVGYFSATFLTKKRIFIRLKHLQ